MNLHHRKNLYYPTYGSPCYCFSKFIDKYDKVSKDTEYNAVALLQKIAIELKIIISGFRDEIIGGVMGY